MQVAFRFLEIGEAEVQDYKIWRLRTGRMERPPAGPRGPSSKFTPEVRKQLRISIGRLWILLRERRATAEKSRSTLPGRTPQRVNSSAVSGGKKPARSIRRKLIFLDESSGTTEMSRHYGRAGRGERVGEGTPSCHWRTLTILGAIRMSGWGHHGH